MRIFAVASVAVLAAGLLTAPGVAAAPSTAPALKCVNLNSGVSANLARKSCPRGWVKANSGEWQKKQRGFLIDVHDLDSSTYLVDDSTLIEGGKVTCQLLDAGGNFSQIVSSIVDSGLDSGTGAAIVVAGVYNLCPGHQKFLDKWLESL